MKISEGLHVNLLGVMKNPASVPEKLRHHSSIYIARNPETGKETKAYITFQRNPETGYFTPPTTELDKGSMNYFLIEIVNAYREARMAVKTRIKNKWIDKEVRTDRKKIQRCRVNGLSLVIRVSTQGKTEIFLLGSPTENNRKKVNCSAIFDGDLIFEDEILFNNMIEENNLQDHKAELKQLFNLAKTRKFEHRMDLSKAKYNLYKKKNKAENKSANSKFESKPESKSEAKPRPESKPKPQSQPKVKSFKDIDNIVSTKRKTDPDKKRKLIDQKTDKGIAELNLSRNIARKLSKKFETLENLEQASDKEILSIQGIGKKTLKQVRRVK